MNIEKHSNIFIISGPSGAGEDTIYKELLKKFDIERIITTSTRLMRPGESQGKPYYFISKEEFLKGVNGGKFFEYAEEDNGNYYGVTKAEVERVREMNKIVVWLCDYQGVLTVKKLIPNAIAILITAPLDVLEYRIRKRDNADDEYVKGRMEHAKGWFENRDKFDYEVENEQGKLAKAVEKVADIIKRHYYDCKSR